MVELNTMMLEQARNGLHAQLEVATTNGDFEAVKKITDDITKLAVQSAPKAPPYGDAEIRAELEKAPWFGIDPEKSAKAVEFGKTMDPKKFATAALFAETLIKSVDAKFPAPKTESGEGDDGTGGEGDDDTGGEGGKEAVARAAPRARKTDAPGEGDVGARNTARASSGPWTKLTDAPAAVQTEIRRSADKFVSANAPKEQREAFIKNALVSHYGIHARSKGKK